MTPALDSNLVASAERLKAGRLWLGISRAGDVVFVKEESQQADDIARRGGSLWRPDEMLHYVTVSDVRERRRILGLKGISQKGTNALPTLW